MGIIRSNRRVNRIEGASKVMMIGIEENLLVYYSCTHLNFNTAEFHSAFYICISALSKMTCELCV